VSRPILFIAGRDPQLETAGGHSAYVRAHCRAALRKDFEPHLFCVSRASGSVETEYGIVHRACSPVVRLTGIWTRGAPIDVPIIAGLVTRLAPRLGHSHLIHGFAHWASAGVVARDRLRRRGIAVTTASSFYTTVRHESIAIRDQRLRQDPGRLAVRPHLRHAWLALALGGHERRAVRRSQVLLANYEHVRGLLDAEYGVGERVRLLPYASETAFEATRSAWRLPAPTPSPLIVAVSRQDPRKGVDRLIAALARLAGAGLDFRAELVGPGPLLERHRRLVRDLGLGDRVALPGEIPEVMRVLRRAALFVLPSLEEGSGSLALLEALQAGVPVVASACDGVVEDITHEVNGLLVAPGDVAALTAAIHRLFHDEPLRRRIAAAGRRTFEERFSAPAFADAIGRLYAELGFEP